MNDLGDERRLRQGGLRFFGRIMASISHEFNNVITIIGEVAGLLEDLSFLAESGRPIAPQRLRKQCDLIAKQLQRAQTIIKQMNRFAHSVDQSRERFDLGAEARVTAGLSERLAALKGFSFELPTEGEPLWVEGRRFLFHELLFVLFSTLFESGARGGVIEVRSDRAGAGSRLTVTSALEDAGAPDGDRVSYATLLAAELGGELEAGAADDGRLAFTVTLPAPD